MDPVRRIVQVVVKEEGKEGGKAVRYIVKASWKIDINDVEGKCMNDNCVEGK